MSRPDRHPPLALPVRARGGLGQSDVDEGIRQVRHFLQNHGRRFSDNVLAALDEHLKEKTK